MINIQAIQWVRAMRRVVSNLAVFACVAAGFGVVLWVSAWVVRPQLSEREFPYSKQ